MSNWFLKAGHHLLFWALQYMQRSEQQCSCWRLNVTSFIQTFDVKASARPSGWTWYTWLSKHSDSEPHVFRFYVDAEHLLNMFLLNKVKRNEVSRQDDLLHMLYVNQHHTHSRRSTLLHTTDILVFVSSQVHVEKKVCTLHVMCSQKHINHISRCILLAFPMFPLIGMCLYSSVHERKPAIDFCASIAPVELIRRAFLWL